MPDQAAAARTVRSARRPGRSRNRCGAERFRNAATVAANRKRTPNLSDWRIRMRRKRTRRSGLPALPYNEADFYRATCRAQRACDRAMTDPNATEESVQAAWDVAFKSYPIRTW